MKKAILFPVFLFISTLAMSQDSCRLTLSGHVEDADTRDKLEVATVVLNATGRQVTTDARGDFRFDMLCPGTYSITITHVDCEPLTMSITLDRSRHTDFLLPHARNTLSEVVVDSRTAQQRAAFRQELTGRKLEEARGQTISEALSKINGVTLLQTGSTISKPIIHGLHGSRILTINNGVRQEGQQWGNEHAPEIDPFIADKLTVIKGVDELRYGSDAIGGVILVQPKALLTAPGYRGEVNAGYFTNNQQFIGSAIFEQHLSSIPGLVYRLQGTYRIGGNARTPDYRLNNTGSRELNFSGTVGWRKNQFNTELFYSYFSTELGIFTGSHIGNLTDLQTAIDGDRPADVFLGQQTYNIARPRQEVSHHLIKSRSQYAINGHKFTLQVAGQFNNRQEFDIVRSSTLTTPQLNLSISTLSEDLTWERPASGHFSGVVGISGVQQDNAYAGRYFIPNYRSMAYGAYVMEKWSRHNWELQAGVRADHRRIATNRLLTGGGATFDQYDFDFTTLAASASAGYKFNQHFQSRLGISLSGRAPYVNELLSNGIHHGTATYEQGDINLKPEQSLNTTLTTNWTNKQNTASIELSLYSNRINRFIYQQPDPANPVLTVAGAFPLIAYRQTNARLNGMDVSAVIRPVKQLEWTSRASILRAKDRTNDTWLIWMPADRVSTEFAWNFTDGKKLRDGYVAVELQQVFRQGRVPDDRNGRMDYKDAPGAYFLAGVNGSVTVQLGNQPIVLSAGVRNLFDVAYRDYLNRMRYFTDELGSNINFRIRVPFGSIKSQKEN